MFSIPGTYKVVPDGAPVVDPSRAASLAKTTAQSKTVQFFGLTAGLRFVRVYRLELRAAIVGYAFLRSNPAQTDPLENVPDIKLSFALDAPPSWPLTFFNDSREFLPSIRVGGGYLESQARVSRLAPYADVGVEYMLKFGGVFTRFAVSYRAQLSNRSIHYSVSWPSDPGFDIVSSHLAFEHEVVFQVSVGVISPVSQ